MNYTSPFKTDLTKLMESWGLSPREIRGLSQNTKLMKGLESSLKEAIELKKTKEEYIRTQHLAHKDQWVPVNKYSIDGTLLSTYESLTAAVNDTKSANKVGIIRACKGIQQTSAGYMWRYTNEEQRS